jgi:predicted nucleic acid-binding protein
VPVLLDTSILIRGSEDPGDDVAISVVSLAELHFGVLVAADEEARAVRLRRFGKIEESFDPLSFKAAAARECGGPYAAAALAIAATAMSTACRC